MVSDANLTLQATTTRTVSGAGPTTELGAQCDGRGMAARVIVTALTGTATFRVEHSADGASWATAGTVVGGAVYAPGEYVILLASARCYLRLAVTLAGGSPSVTYSGDLAPQRFGEGRERRLVLGTDAPSGPAILFADDFEGGTLVAGGWTASEFNHDLFGDTARREAGSAHAGGFGVHLAGAAGATLAHALDASAGNTWSLLFDVKWIAQEPGSWLSWVLPAGGIVVNLKTEAGGTTLSVSQAREDGGDPSGFVAGTTTGKAFPDATWATAEIVYDGSLAAPQAVLSVDGVAALTLTDPTTGAARADLTDPPMLTFLVSPDDAAQEYHLDTVSVADGVQGV